jgi:hypothetical protein
MVNLSSVLSGQPLYEAIVKYYEKAPLPSCIVVDFFAFDANDAGDRIGVPVITIFPNPLGYTSLPAPGKRNGWWLHELQCYLSEAVAARMACSWRNISRNVRELPALTEQDMWPSSQMTRFTIATTGKGLEYEFPHSPL